jgi:flavin-dependent dehydrogenase
MLTIPPSTDVLIAGCGPAGLAAAIAARRHGFDVVVADRASSPIDKVCGEGLMPEAVETLGELGVKFDACDRQPFLGIRFSAHGRSVEARFADGSGFGVRRTTLHRILATGAADSGARLLWDAPVASFSGDTALVAGQAVRFRYLVGADGEGSAIRRAAGLDRRLRDGRRFGFRKHFEMEPWTDFVEVHWARECQMYVTPVGPRQVNVALLSRDRDLRFSAALARFPELASRLKGVPSTPERGSVSASRRLSRVWRGRVALIGDASGSVDAVTGYGMSLAFQQAAALAKALAAGNLETYQARHDSLRRRPALMADLMLLMDGRERLRRRVFAAFSAKPEIFSRLLALHTGNMSPWVLANIAVSFGWNLLTA